MFEMCLTQRANMVRQTFSTITVKLLTAGILPMDTMVHTLHAELTMPLTRNRSFLATFKYLAPPL